MIVEIIFILFVLIIVLAGLIPSKMSKTITTEPVNKKRELSETLSEDIVVEERPKRASAKSVRFSNERNERLYSIETGQTLKDLVGKT